MVAIVIMTVLGVMAFKILNLSMEYTRAGFTYGFNSEIVNSMYYNVSILSINFIEIFILIVILIIIIHTFRGFLRNNNALEGVRVWI